MYDYERGSALLSVQQAAANLCVSAHIVRRWIEDGSLPVQRNATGAIRIRGEDVEKLLRSKIWLSIDHKEIWPEKG